MLPPAVIDGGPLLATLEGYSMVEVSDFDCRSAL